MTPALIDHRARLDCPRTGRPRCTPDCLEVIDMPTPYLVTDLDTVAQRLRRVHRGAARRAGVLRDEVQPVAGDPAARWPAAAPASRSPRSASCGCCSASASTRPTCSTATRSSRRRTSPRRTRPGCGGSASTPPDELRQDRRARARRARSTSGCGSTTGPASSRCPASSAPTLEDAFDLMLLARRLGLRPYGITFHVGSQCGNPAAWRQAIARRRPADGRARRGRASSSEMLDLGGGFPARYVERRAVHRGDRRDAITPALDELLPYRPELLAAEPGRHLVAESAVMAAGVHRPRACAAARTGCSSTSAPTTA